jgi:hypothetical protein
LTNIYNENMRILLNFIGEIYWFIEYCIVSIKD